MKPDPQKELASAITGLSAVFVRMVEAQRQNGERVRQEFLDCQVQLNVALKQVQEERERQHAYARNLKTQNQDLASQNAQLLFLVERQKGIINKTCSERDQWRDRYELVDAERKDLQD